MRNNWSARSTAAARKVGVVEGEEDGIHLAVDEVEEAQTEGGEDITDNLIFSSLSLQWNGIMLNTQILK